MNEGVTQVVVCAVRPLDEVGPRPCCVVRVGFTRAQVPLDLIEDV
jgi:hypothetical protein